MLVEVGLGSGLAVWPGECDGAGEVEISGDELVDEDGVELVEPCGDGGVFSAVLDSAIAARSVAANSPAAISAFFKIFNYLGSDSESIEGSESFKGFWFFKTNPQIKMTKKTSHKNIDRDKFADADAKLLAPD
ncbi:MAG: hypothetical protein RLZZ258_939 [Actinomycetota bacterium]